MRKINNLKTYIENTIITLCVFVLSLTISPYYIYGDQFHYREAYSGIVDLNLKDAYKFYVFNTSGKEVIPFFLSWLASNQDLDKDIFIAFSNAALAFFSILLMRKLKVSIWIIAVLLLTNYYFYVLYFAAERLKFGFIFFLLSILYMRHFYIFSFLAILSHIQMIIFYASMSFSSFFEEIIKKLIKGKVTKRGIGILFLSFLIIFIVYFTMWGHLQSKFQTYYDIANHNITDLIKVFLLYIMTWWYSRNRYESTLIFIPLFISVFLVGGERINVMAYFIFLYYALPIKKGFNMGILSTLVYFMYAGFNFMINIIEYGVGYYQN